MRPGSRCPSCLRPLAWYENLPVLSWLALRGRCRTCGTRISVQYPIVELAVGGLFAGNFALFGGPHGPEPASALAALAGPHWIVASVFTTILLAIALTDLRTYLIPDELSIGGLALGTALSLLPGGLSPVASLLGAAVGGGLLLAVAWVGALVFRKEAMGGGDIKMLAMIGAFTGWRGVFLTLFLGALLGSIIYGPIALAVRARRKRATPALAAKTWPPATDEDPADEVDRLLVPFGVFLALGAALSYYLGEDLVQAYLRMVGLSR